MKTLPVNVIIEKESTHKVPTSHYHTKHCHAAVIVNVNATLGLHSQGLHKVCRVNTRRQPVLRH